MKSYIYLIVLAAFIIQSCSSSSNKDESVDIIFYNGEIYTVDSLTSYAEAVAVKDGEIVAVGKQVEVELLKSDSTLMYDLKGAFMMPGFIEGHGHLSALGRSLINLNFINSKNWKEIVDQVDAKANEIKDGEWIEGFGWHQEKWDEIPNLSFKDYPLHHELSKVSENNPAMLIHASGHSLFANKKAMDLAGITSETPDPVGGVIVRDGNGEAIGVFEERAMSLIIDAYREYKDNLDQRKVDSLWYKAVEYAQEECIQKGVTSFQDAGSKFYELDRYNSLAKHDSLKVRLWAMVRHSSDEMKGELQDYKSIDVGNKFYTCNAIKSEIDGALGAFGAWLLKPYSDKPGYVGQNTTDVLEVKKIAELALENEMQMCVHAIGDRANRVVVDLYEALLNKEDAGKDRRWRVEHAQHINPEDIPRFKENGIIASMQGIHCTSDAPFVEKRLGEERSKNGAYAWRSFLDAGVVNCKWYGCTC